jgi:hypothetical protein
MLSLLFLTVEGLHFLLYMVLHPQVIATLLIRIVKDKAKISGFHDK